ncbi:MAG: limonene-1,2-epoxide hydrolase family protein [Pseudomonadales bacterium]
MDWAAYKALCARPDVFSRALLEWTRSRVADDALQAVFDTLLNQPPIGKPSDFSGDARTDMFVVRFDTGQAQRIIDRLAGDGLDRRQRHAVVVWREYLAMFAGADSEQYGLLGEMMQPQERVTALMRAFDARDLDAIEACFTPDAVYHNIPMEPVTGSAAIRASLAPFLGMASEIRFEVLQSAANGSVVMNERVDRFLVNGRWIAVRVMGVFEVSAAGITAWRDYFDLAEFQQQMGG